MSYTFCAPPCVCRHGTMFYAAPEVMEKGHMYLSSDIYSWAVMMWECITGHTPYAPLEPAGPQAPAGAESPRWPPPSPSSTGCKMSWHPSFPALPPSCPHPLQDIIYSCLSPDPLLRPDWPSIMQCLSGVQAWLASSGRTASSST